MVNSLVKTPLKLAGMLDQASKLVERLFARGVLYSLLSNLPSFVTVLIAAYVGPGYEDPNLASFVAALITIPGALLSGLLYLFGNGVLIQAASDLCMGRSVNWSAAQLKIKGIWLQLIITSLVLVLWILMGLCLFIIPGIIIALNAVLLLPIMVSENSNRSDSWQRSKELMKGHRLRYAGYSLILFLMSMLIGAILGAVGFFIFGDLSNSLSIGRACLNTAISMITFTWFPVFNTLFYYDLRVRKEAADLELASETVEVCATT